MRKKVKVIGELTPEQKKQVDAASGTVSAIATRLGLTRQYVQDYIRGTNENKAAR
jgi:predicted transcriptional regulator